MRFAAVALLALLPANGSAAPGDAAPEDDRQAAALRGNAPPVIAAAAKGPTDAEVTLTECIALAMRNNRRLVNARLNRAVQRFALEVAEDKFWPDLVLQSSRRFGKTGADGNWTFADAMTSSQVTLRVPTGGEMALLNSVASGGEGTSTYDSALTLRFRQPLLKGAGFAVNRASVRIARADERINALVFEGAIGDVIASVAHAYRGLVQAQRRTEISARSLQRARALLQTNQSLIQAGRMARAALSETEGDVAERELVLIGSENAVDAARLVLINLLDIDSETPLRPAPEVLAATPQRPAFGPSMELALAHRPEYLQALLRIENARDELLLARNNRLWDLSTTFEVDVDGGDRTFLRAAGEPFQLVDEGDYRVGLQLRIPLGDKTLKQRVLRASASLKQAQNDLAELRQSLEINVRNAVREVDVRWRQVALARRASGLARQTLEAERQKLNLGLTTSYRMILFEDDLVRIENREIDAAIGYLNALTSLDQTLGTTLQTWGLEVEGVERIEQGDGGRIPSR